MKRLFAIGAAALVGVAAGIWGGAGSVALALLAPFTGIASGLRALSLSGRAGDIAAWALYALMAFAPLAGLLPRGRRRGLADILLALSAVYGFFYWYAMANPTLFLPAGLANEAMEPVFQAMLTGLLASLIFGALAVRLTEDTGGAGALISRLRLALGAISLLVALAAAASAAISLRAAAAEGGAALGYAAFLSALDIAVSAALIGTLLSARSLLYGMRGGWFAEDNIARAEALSRGARALLLATIARELLANAAAVCLIGRVSDSSVTFSPPILELVMACALLLLARFVRDGALLRRENDEFI